MKPGKFDDFPWTTSQGEKAYFFVGSGIRTIYHYIYMLIYVYINIYIYWYVQSLSYIYILYMIYV